MCPPPGERTTYYGMGDTAGGGFSGHDFFARRLLRQMTGRLGKPLKNEIYSLVILGAVRQALAEHSLD